MSTFVGHVDSLSSLGVLEGWAIDTRNPMSAAKLTLLLDGKAAGDFECMGLREDVLAAGYPTAAAGFSHRVDARFWDGVERKISFRPTEGGEAFELDGLKTVCLNEGRTGEVALSPMRDRLVGWVANTSTKRRPVFLEVRIDGAPYAIERLKGSAESAGEIEFSIPLPSEIVENRNICQIEVKLLGSNNHLSGSPLPSRTSQTIGSFDELTGTSIRGWAFDVGLRRSTVLDVFCDDVIIMQVHCDGARDDVFKHLGVRACGFEVRLPAALLGPSPSKVHLQFQDGAQVPGGPKYFQALDLELITLERKLHGDGSAVDETASPSSHPFDDEIACIGRILAAPPHTSDISRYRARTIELGYEILGRALFTLPPEDAIDVAVKLALLGISICRKPEDFQIILPMMQQLPQNTPNVYGLIELERQRRRPFNRLLLAGVLLSQGRGEQAIDMIFDSHSTASEKDRNTVALLGVEMLVRAGKADEAQDLLLVHLTQ